MDPAPEMDSLLLHVSFLFVPRYLFFDLIFQSEPSVSSFQMGIIILSGMHKKWLVSQQIHRNSQIIGSVRFSTRVVKKGSVCASDRSVQNLGFEAQGPIIFEYHNRDDIMGMFTWTFARTYNFSHLSRTIVRCSINVVRCMVREGPLSITPFLRTCFFEIPYSHEFCLSRWLQD